ncbi:MAG TPA: hypothetical protein VFV72_11220 [Candidatus Limnocylindrales bacterium]|nr:hypothetical protein [Candidatus Limnocylindrales bacterium]
MNETADRLLVDWLAEGPERGPLQSLERALAATRRTSQRPGWTIPERWIPMQLTMRPALNPRPYILFLAGLLLIVAAGALFVIGSQRQKAPPFGLAANGSIVVGVDSELWLVSADGAPAMPLNNAMGKVTSPVFSPDGTKIAFMTRPTVGTPFALYVANPDGSDAHSVTGGMRVVTPDPVLAGITWSPDGSTLIFGSLDAGRNRLYTVGVDGRGLGVITGSDADRSWPTWSPDGAWVAYQLKVPDGWSTNLAIMRADGTGERVLQSDEVSNASFAGSQWLNDSSGLAYFKTGHVVARTDLNGHETILSRPGEDAVNPVISPDDRRVAYGLLTGAAIVDLADAANRVDIPAGLAECGAAWAPDATALLGLGTDCRDLFWIPADDPAAAKAIRLPEGEVTNATWQRLAP